MQNPPIMDAEDEVDQLAKEIATLRETVDGLFKSVQELIQQRDHAVAKLDALMATLEAQ